LDVNLHIQQQDPLSSFTVNLIIFVKISCQVRDSPCVVNVSQSDGQHSVKCVCCRCSCYHCH